VGGDGGPLIFEGQPKVARIVEVAAKYGIEIPMNIAEETWLRNPTKEGQR
jgi:hypothetical protein